MGVVLIKNRGGQNFRAQSGTPLPSNIFHCLPYSWKYWWELNLAVGSQMAIAKALANFNLAVWYGIAIRI